MATSVQEVPMKVQLCSESMVSAVSVTTGLLKHVVENALLCPLGLQYVKARPKRLHSARPSLTPIETSTTLWLGYDVDARTKCMPWFLRAALL